MQSQNSDPYFIIFERRRLKVAETHRTRREQLFNKSRNILSNELDSLSLEPSNSQSSNVFNQTKGEQDGQSSLNVDNAFDSPLEVNVEQREISNMMDVTEKSNQMEDNQQKKQQNIKNYGKRQRNYKRYEKKKRNYGKILQVPSWMNTVPEELNKFYGMARPSGKAGLLAMQQGWMTIYDKFGKITSINKFSQTNENQDLIKNVSQHFHDTIFDIIFCQQTQIIYIIDLISWKSTIMSAENFEFRYAWLLSNVGQLVNYNFVGFKIQLTQYFPLNSKENLSKIYLGDFGYQKEGLLFVQKDSPYVHSYNDNVMIWKDFQTSKYPIDQSSRPIQQQNQKQKSASNYIYGVGKVTKTGNIYSLDGFKLGHIEPSIIPAFTGGYIKYRITSISFKGQHSHQPQQNGMQAQGDAHKDNGMKIELKDFEAIHYRKYGKAEPLSRIMFQHRMKYDPLKIQQIASKIQ